MRPILLAVLLEISSGTYCVCQTLSGAIYFDETHYAIYSIAETYAASDMFHPIKPAHDHSFTAGGLTLQTSEGRGGCSAGDWINTVLPYTKSPGTTGTATAQAWHYYGQEPESCVPQYQFCYSEGTRAITPPPAAVILDYAAFISWASIDSPPGLGCFRGLDWVPYRFNGNNRTFGLWGLQNSKAWTSTTIYPSSGYAYRYEFGAWAHAYAGDTPTSGGPNGPFIEVSPDPPGDCVALDNSKYAYPTVTLASQMSTSTNGARIIQQGYAVNPHVPNFEPFPVPTGSITWFFDVEVSVSPAQHLQSARGGISHTCFPSHEVYANGTRLYSYQPVSPSAATIAFCLFNGPVVQASLNYN